MDGRRALSAALLVLLATAGPLVVPDAPAFGGEVQRRPAQPLRADAPGEVELDVELPTGWKLNPGAPLTYRLAVADDDRLGVQETDRYGVVTPPRVPVVVPLVAGAPGETVLTVTLTFAYCREDERGVCLLGSATIEQPLALTPASAPSRIRVSYRAPPPPALFR